MTKTNDLDIEFWMGEFPELTRKEIEEIIDEECDDLETVTKHIN
jgi:hypothetical protein